MKQFVVYAIAALFGLAAAHGVAESTGFGAGADPVVVVE